MFTNVLIAVKEGVEHAPLLELAQKAAHPPAKLHLASLVRVGTNEDEPQRLELTRRTLEESAEQLRLLGYEVSCEARLLVFAAATDLLRVADERKADLIVIGLAKRSRVGKALMGSDAQRVLLSADCPVLVTRTY